MFRKLLVVAGAVIAMGSLAAVTGAVPFDREDGVVLFNSDVYVQGENGLLENPSDLTPSDAPLYNIAGTPLEVSWGEWSAAAATSIVKTKHLKKDPWTDVDLTFTGLIPGGVYSVFYITFEPETRNPFCVNGERGIPLETRHREKQAPDASSFVADAAGMGEFRGRAEGALLDARYVHFVLIYHFDGRTYHPLANYGESATQGEEVCRPSYGADAMRQLLVVQKSPE